MKTKSPYQADMERAIRNLRVLSRGPDQDNVHGDLLRLVLRNMESLMRTEIRGKGAPKLWVYKLNREIVALARKYGVLCGCVTYGPGKK